MGNVFEAMKRLQAQEPVAGPAGNDAPKVDCTQAKAAAAAGPAVVEVVEPKHKARTAQQPAQRPDGRKYSPLVMTHHDRGGEIAEEYRQLRTNLLAHKTHDRFCYMVTSSAAGEGKTLTCLNLGVIMTEYQDCRTILIDCDLRRRRMAQLMGIDSSHGLADVLRRQAPLADVIQPTAYANLDFAPSGMAGADEVGKLLTSLQLEGVIAQVRKEYDFVLIDTPPVNVVAETCMIGRAVGEALLVVRMHKTSRESIDRATSLLHSANVNMVGMVLTGRKCRVPGYLYRRS